MSKRPIIFLLLVGLLSSVKAHVINATYHLEFSATNLREVKVTARLPIDRPELEMVHGGIPPDIEGGWSSFVDIQSIRHPEGHRLKWESLPGGGWALSDVAEKEILIHYLVRLEHDDHPWNTVGGIDSRPTVLGPETLYWVNRGLFVLPVGVSMQAEVTIDIPDRWQVSTSWVRADSALTYRTTNVRDLVDNVMMIGVHAKEVLQLDSMNLTLAIAPGLKDQADLFKQTLGVLLPGFRELFGELPVANYLICLSENTFEDGEAFYSSFHQMLINRALHERKIVWANLLAHEMFHYWNGTHFLVSDNHQESEWFSEGFTEYYANLALIRGGIIAKEAFLSKLSFQFSRYFTAKFLFPLPRPTLVSAGREKGRNWALIYGGGATTAFVLDVQIREQTGGARSLDDLMRWLYDEFGTKQLRISNAAIIQGLNEITGKDYAPFYNQYINGQDLLPLLETCERAGLVVAQYQGEFYLEAPKDDSIMGSIMRPE